MSLVKSSNSKAEMIVRRALFGLGYRYRLHKKGILGTPDIAFVGRRKLIFVNGCFWHRHPGCKKARIPKSNSEFWRTKLEMNQVRDLRVHRMLTEQGWSILVVWECETNDKVGLIARLTQFMEELQ
jgi:DNA mismatch endonuclease (patch repair protein)